MIGNTPMLKLNNLKNKESLLADVLIKLEGNNPAGSAKDRVAYQMIADGEDSGTLKRGESVIIEPTSGNTGIGLAFVALPLGYRVIIVMPENMSEERKKIIRAYGADLVCTDASKGMTGAIEKAEELAGSIKGAVIAGQFTNPSNPKAHYLTTGPEIWRDCAGKVDVLVAGIGTGGTISGAGKFLKEKRPDILIVGVEPKESPFISEGRAGAHKIQGIGAGFVPKTLDLGVVDAVEQVSYDQCKSAVLELAKEEGVLVGISSGASLSVAIRLAKLPENQGKTIVAIMPDGGDKYLSTDLFE